MYSEVAITTKEPLLRLQILCERLYQEIRKHGLTHEEAFAVLHSSVSAECVDCGIMVSGEELFAVSQPPVETETSPKIARMRLGDCARKGCNCLYYEFTFKPYPRVDWPSLLEQAKVVKEDKGSEAINGRKLLRALSVHWNRGLARRIALAAILVVALFVAHQYRYGGRIPLIREPERFRVGYSVSEQQEGPE
jgi:hypothetical protein